MPAIAAAHPACLALIVGDGTEKSALERLARELGVEGRVRFEGAVPHARVKDYLHAADLFVSTQSVTNFGIHLMEAMVCGRCVVTLDTGDTGKHVVNGETGVLLEPGRIDLVAEAVTGLLGDDERRARLGANARAYAESHFQTWDERMDIEVRIVEDLVAGRARRRDRD